MRYILDAPNQVRFLDKILYDKDCDDEKIPEMVDGCRYFYFEIHGNSYFLSKSIVRDFKRENLPTDYISLIFDLKSSTNFYIEEFNVEFIDYLLNSYSNVAKDLDAEIFDLHESFVNRYE